MGGGGGGGRGVAEVLISGGKLIYVRAGEAQLFAEVSGGKLQRGEGF